MADTIQFSRTALPAHESVLWVMQLLAQAVHEILARQSIVYDFEKVGISSIDVPRILGYFAAARLPVIGSSKKEQPASRRDHEESEALRDIWNDFLREDRIRRLPKSLISSFEQHRDSTIAAASAGKLTFDYLKLANRSAHAFVKDLLKKQRLNDLLPASPADIDIVPDPESRLYCAASDRQSGRIQWALQIVPHALVAMVLVERVFAHEYLSHLAPRNQALGRAVLERWLVALLHETYMADQAQMHWKNILWPEYRKALEDHVASMETTKNRALNPVRTFGYAGVEVVAAALYDRAPSEFWKFTREMVTGEPNEADAAKIGRILVIFANNGPKHAKGVLKRKWNNIDGLCAIADSLKNTR